MFLNKIQRHVLQLEPTQDHWSSMHHEDFILTIIRPYNESHICVVDFPWSHTFYWSTSLAWSHQWRIWILHKEFYLGFCPPSFWAKGFEINWIYKIKNHSNGTFTYWKSCLVINGYTQCYDIDYDQTYFPMGKHESIWTIFSFVVTHDMSIIYYDIKMTFLYGDLHEEISMEQLKGYIKLKIKQFFCHLCKNIYGLCQLVWQWNFKFDFLKTKYNFVASDANYCVYYKNDHIETIIRIFVDGCSHNPMSQKRH